jgi:uncharacterized protein (DUF4415 family)
VEEPKAEGSTSRAIRDAVQKVKERLRIDERKSFTFLLMGRTGVGKSSTINSLVGKPVAQVGMFTPTTIAVEKYSVELSGITFQVYDTPGLCDDLDERGNDAAYLAQVRKAIKSADCLWFVTRLDEPRVTAEELTAVRLISEAFGINIWQHSLLVLTHANNVVPLDMTRRKPGTPEDCGEYFRWYTTNRVQALKNEMSRLVPRDIIDKIPCVAVENNLATLVTGDEWLPELYTTTIERISDGGLLPFYLATLDSIAPKEFVNGATAKQPTDEKEAPEASHQPRSKPSEPDAALRIGLSDDQKSRVQKRIDASIIAELTALGAGIGFLFGPAGAAVGGTIGALFGSLLWLRKR